ncbi:MAG: bifunctional 3'-5' exonuclease/DNA polymerase [Oscillospiraceae bacterium]|nr:bifunctional 3'-5' exonuclease/DNA polymerase [Oscillospiraceae bacterium]
MEFIKISNKQEIIPYLLSLKQAKVLAVDTETTGLDPHTDKLRLIQIAAAGLPVLVIDCFSFLPDGIELIKDILETPAVKIFQNAKFDLQFFMAAQVYPYPIFDTMLAGQLLRTSGGASRVGLDALAQHYLNEILPKDEQKSNWSGNLSESQFEYAANDADVLLRLREVMVRKIYENKLSEIALIEFSCVSAIAQMEYTGICLDTPCWNRLLAETVKERDEALEILYTYTGKPAVQMSLFGEDTVYAYNFDSNPFVLNLLQKNGIQTNSTSKHDLTPYAKHPLVQAVSAYRRAAKSLSSFLYPIPFMIHPTTGRLHPHYGQNGAWSGRMSCGNPNIQQIPRSSDFRACFIAPLGRKLVVADYSQIELRVAAEITLDDRMMTAYRNGDDLHKLTASLMLGKSADTITKQERQAAKAVNFGLIYAMGAAGLKQYAAQSYGVEMTLEQAEEFKSRFFNAYTGIERWHRELKKFPPTESRTLTGRKFTFSPNAGLAALCNTPVQGTAADIAKKALGLLINRLRNTDTHIVGVVHDEILLETSEENADKMAELLKSTMEEAGNSILKYVPCQADVNISSNWAKT